jgi:hypothetical protein
MQTATKTNFKKDPDTGKWYTETKPDNFRVAELEDFYKDKETELNPQLLIGKAFLVHSFHDNYYWASRVSERFPYPGSDFLTFLEMKRVYVFE